MAAHASTRKTGLGQVVLAPLSLALQSIHGVKRDPSPDASRTAGDAVASIDSYCTAHPDKLAADGAGTYFKMLAAS